MKIYIVSKYNPDLCYTEDKVFTSFYKAQEYYGSMRKSIQKEADASNAAHHEAVTKDGGFQQKDGYSILSSCHYYNFYGEFTYEWENGDSSRLRKWKQRKMKIVSVA